VNASVCAPVVVESAGEIIGSARKRARFAPERAETMITEGRL
jgi:hypothetical protein